MFAGCFFILSCLMLGASGSEILKALLGEGTFLSSGLTGRVFSDDTINDLIEMISKLPFTSNIKTEAWFLILRYRTPQSMHLNDWKKYEALLPYLPYYVVQAINFSDHRILMYFGQQKLGQVLLSQMAEQVKRKSGKVFQNEKLIYEMGNIFCGFSQRDLTEIKASTLRSLLEKNFFQTIKSCSYEQLMVLSQIMIQHAHMGPPRTWEPEQVRQAGSLVAGLDALGLKEIRTKSFSQISPDVIRLIPQEFLKEMKNSQLKALGESALMAWRRRTQDLRQINDNEAFVFSAKISVLTVTCACILAS